MIKWGHLAKRKAGTTFKQFQEYYENHHTQFIKFAPLACRYRRRYLRPITDPFHPQDESSTFDVMNELWFPDQAAFDASFIGQDPENIKLIVEDEARFMDRDAALLFLIEDIETPLPKK